MFRLITLSGLLILLALPAWAADGPPNPQPLREVADTVACFFAAEGPGSPGSPGTFAQGFDFEDMEPAGWFAVDPWEDVFHWHVEEVSLTAGHGTDMGAAIPFWPEPPENDYALWCGDPQWPGYGSNWSEALRVELGLTVTETLQISFAYAGSFEGDDWDYFDLLVLSGADTLQAYVNQVELEETFLQIALEIPGAELSGEVHALEFWFRSDGNTDDEYGLLDSDIGAVWLDNIQVAADNTVYIQEDFEDGLMPPGFSVVTDICGDMYAALHQDVEVPFECWTNTSTLWGFFDPETVEPGYPDGVIPYGPPYPLLMIQSPDLTVGQDGEPMGFRLDEVRSVLFSMDLFEDLYADALLAWDFEVSARTRETGLWGDWVDPAATTWPEEICYEPYLVNMEPMIAESAGGENLTIDGLRLRIEVQDMCPLWCGIYGDGHPHTPAILVDNVRVMLTDVVTAADEFPTPAAARLLPLQPNPFNPRAEIRFELAAAGEVLLTVHDIAGRRLATLAEGRREAGTHLESWRGLDDNGRALPSGVYLVRLESRDGVSARKAVLIQ